MKTDKKTITLDGEALKALKAADNGTINAAAEAGYALSIAADEWIEARLAMEKAEEAAAATGKRSIAAIKAVADSLRGEAEKRGKAITAYSEELIAKEYEVAVIYPELNGVLAALKPYAVGEVGIDKPLTYAIGWERKFVPNVTDANRAAIAAFKPLRRNVPDTSAIRVSAGAEAATFSGLIAARKRYETACQALADTLEIYEGAEAALAAEADDEAESVEKAAAIQAERDA